MGSQWAPNIVKYMQVMFFAKLILQCTPSNSMSTILVRCFSSHYIAADCNLVMFEGVNSLLLENCRVDKIEKFLFLRYFTHIG